MQVMRGLEEVRNEGSVTRREDLGVTVVRAPHPLHYYSLFSWSTGTDVVVAVYSGNRYEVECKYTQFVNLHSRRVWPRVSLEALAEVRPLPRALTQSQSWCRHTRGTFHCALSAHACHCCSWWCQLEPPACHRVVVVYRREEIQPCCTRECT